MTLVKRKLGGTDLPTDKTGNTDKWSDGISQQLSGSSERVNVKMVPLDQVKLDPNNARILHFSYDELRKGPKLSDYTTQDGFDQDAFSLAVANYCKGKIDETVKIEEYLSLAELAQSIKNPSGLINPITTYLDGMEFVLIAGHRRTLAHYILGAQFIAAKVLDQKPSLLSHSILQWKENLDRSDLNLAEQIRNLSRIISEWEAENQQTISVRKLADLINQAKTKASWYLSIYRETKQNALFAKCIESENIVSLEIAYYISQMKNKDAQTILLNELLSGVKISFYQLLSRAKEPVLSPDSKQNASFQVPALKINTKENLKIMQKLINMIASTNKIKDLEKHIVKENFNTKKGVMAAWEKICLHIQEEENG